MLLMQIAVQKGQIVRKTVKIVDNHPIILYNIHMNIDIINALQHWKDENPPGVLDPNHIAESVQSALRKFKINAIVDVEENDGLDGVLFAIGGAYDPSDIRNHFNICLYFSQTAFSVCCQIDEQWLDRFKTELTNVALHEYRHCEQDQHRGDKLVTTAYQHADNKSQRYLGDSDEVDAYAIGIAYTLNATSGNDGALDLLRDPETMQWEHSSDLYEYMETFGPEHEVTKRLFKKVANHLGDII